MSLTNFIKGLQILQQYFNYPDGYHLQAEHDEIYVSATDKPVSEEDVRVLWDLGWMQTGTPVNEKDEDIYLPEEQWIART